MADKKKYNQAELFASNQSLQELVRLNNENLAMTQDEIKMLERFEDRLVISSEKTASMLSKNLGAEEAFTREISHSISTIFSKNEDIRLAYQKAGDEDKTLMMNQIKDEVLKSYKANEEFFEKNKIFIDNAMVNVESSMDSIVETGNKFMYSLSSSLIRTIDNFRHTITDKFPKTVGRFLSDEMVEHYKTGAKEIGQHFQQHMSTILAPVSAITGPIIAIGKSLFTIGKTLFSGPTKYEKQTAKVQRDIRDILKGERKDARKRWIEDKKQKMKEMQLNMKEKGKSIFEKYIIPIFALGVGLLIGYFSEIKTLISPILGFFKTIGNKFVKIGSFFGKISTKLSTFGGKILSLLTKGPLGRLFLTAGKIFGKLFMPLKMIWNFFKDFGTIKEMFSNGDIVGILKQVAGSILEPLLDLPEMFINALSWIFGSEFRVDFGKDAIIGMIDNVTVWVFDNITVPIMDFFTKTIPEFFNNIFGFFGKAKEYISNLGGKIFGGISKIFGFGDDEKKDEKDNFGDFYTNPSKYLTNEGEKDNFGDFYTNPSKYLTKDLNKPPSLSKNEIAKTKQKNKQIDVANALNDQMKKTHNSIVETNNTNKQIIQNQQNVNVIGDGDGDGIPTEPENMGVMLFSKTWGLS